MAGAGYLSLQQIAALAINEGFTGEALDRMVAITWAESEGQIDADNGADFGITQVNAAAHPQYDVNRLKTDPEYAMHAAWEISNGGKTFDPWTTWSGATPAGKARDARQYLDMAHDATVNVQAQAGWNAGQFDMTPQSAPDTVAEKQPHVYAPPPSQVPSQLDAAGNGAAGTLPPHATPDQIDHYIQVHYPQAAPFLANPEIKALLERPDIDKLDGIEVEALLRGTTYWQTHGPESRAFDALIAKNDGSAGELVDNTKVTLNDLFSKNGLHLDDQQLGDVAKNAIRSGWIDTSGQVANPAQLNHFTAWAIGSQGGQLQGAPAVTADQLGQIAKQYMVPMTPQDLQQRALDITAGHSTTNDFKAEMAQHAKTLFQNDADIVSAIDAGRSPTDYFAPIRNQIASTLELAPDQVDLMSPQYQGVIQMYDPNMPGGGGRRAMTMGEAQQWARNQPGYKQTTAYRQQDADFGLKLAQTFGAV